VTPGERRVLILRYGVSWGRSRFGYTWTPELLDRVSPQARHILQPVAPIVAGSTTIPREAPLNSPNGSARTDIRPTAPSE
jgi:hypothetical protein